MRNHIQEDTDTLVEDHIVTKSEKSKSIVLYNDDHNTFEHVIDCLVNYCKHSNEQAQQCALIVHNIGKCSVKEGNFKKLLPIHEALLEAGLTSKLE